MILKYSTPRSGDGVIVHKWIRKEGKRHYEQLSGFPPYFYVEADQDLEARLGSLRYLVSSIEATDRTTIDGIKLTKLSTRIPKEVPIVRELFDRHWEADVPYSTRFLLDSLGLSDFGEEYLPMYLDIELGIPKGASIEGDYPIICMSTLCNGELKRYRDFGGEETMLSAFLRDYKKSDVDCICGWNTAFDIDRLMLRLGSRARELSPLNYVHQGDNPSIPGRLIFDLYAAYKKLMVNAPIKPRNFSLNTVAEFEFGWEMPAWSRRILEVYENNPEDAVAYNEKHTRLCQMIDDKLSILKTFTERQRIALCEFRDTMHDSLMLDRLLLRKSPYILPSKPKREEGKKKKEIGYEGAIVFEPKKGLHRDVYVMDYKSLYPSIILSLNISPETITNKQTEADFWLEEMNTGFKDSPKGMMPKILEDLLLRRRREKALMKEKGDMHDLRQWALKTLSNSFYGFYGYTRSRLYNKALASSITYVGRMSLLSTSKYLEDMGIEVIYADTDGMMLKGINNPNDLTEMINKYITKCISDNYGVKASQIEIEYETHYKSLFFGKAKKRYAGLDDSGRLTIKGMEVKRRDCPAFGRDLQRDIIRMALEGKSMHEVTLRAREVLDSLRKGRYSLTQMGIPKGLSQAISDYKKHPATGKIFPWAQAVLDTNAELGTNYSGQEDELYFLYTKNGIRACVIGDEDLYRDYKLDMEKIIDMGIIRRVKALYEALGWDLDSIVSGHTQTQLGAYV